MGVELVTLPGGFFVARSSAERDALAKRISSEAARRGIAVAVGIDVKQEQQSVKGQGKKLTATDKKRHEKVIREQTLPSFVVCWSRQSRSHCWRQRSTSSKDQVCVPAQACVRKQSILVNNRSVEVLACGEIFNERIRKAIIDRRPRVKAVVDLAHDGKGLRINPALRRFGECGITSLCSAHVSLKGAMKRGFNHRGMDISSRDSDINIPRNSKMIPHAPRIEAKIYEV